MTSRIMRTARRLPYICELEAVQWHSSDSTGIAYGPAVSAVLSAEHLLYWESP